MFEHNKSTNLLKKALSIGFFFFAIFSLYFFAPNVVEARTCTVRSPLDAGGVAGSSETLRFCIEDINANCTPGAHLIRFNVTSMINNYGGDAVRNECAGGGCLRNPGGESADVNAASPGERVVKIGINSVPLPQLTCDGTVIDAENDFYRQTFGGQTTNSDCLGTGNGTVTGCASAGSGVGTSNTSYSQIRRPLVEIANELPAPVPYQKYNCGVAGPVVNPGYETYGAGLCQNTWGLRVKADNTTIRGLAIYNFLYNIQTISNTGADGVVQGLLVEKNLIGTSSRKLKDNNATGNTPSQEKYTWRNASGLSMGWVQYATIQDNIFNWNFYGLSVGGPDDWPWTNDPVGKTVATNQNESITIQRNEFLYNGPGRFATVGISSPAAVQENLYDYNDKQSTYDTDHIQFRNVLSQYVAGFTVQSNFIHDTVTAGSSPWFPGRQNYKFDGTVDGTGASSKPQGKGIHVAVENYGGFILDNTIARTSQAGVGVFASAGSSATEMNIGVDIWRNEIHNTVDTIPFVGNPLSNPQNFGRGEGIALYYAEPGGSPKKTTNGVSIKYNSLYENEGIGIDLNDDGVTTNDAIFSDPDDGENGFMNSPVYVAQLQVHHMQPLMLQIAMELMLLTL